MPDWLGIGGFLLVVVDFVLAISVTIHAVLWKRDSRSVIAWVGLAWLAPLAGTFAYFLLGVNRIERKAVALKITDFAAANRSVELTEDDLHEREGYVREYPNLVGLALVGQKLTGRSVIPGNSVEPLVDGDQAYPSMLAAINEARDSVTLLSYIFDNDRAGDAFLEALLKAQQRGAEVRILIDDVGSKYSRPTMVGRLKKAGLNAVSFLPTRTPRIPQYANLRNHRKILVVDGKIGFTGGTNIREGHWRKLNPKYPVQCLHFRLTGPTVAQLQQVFASDWEFTTGEALAGPAWFPVISRSGNVWARGIEDGPDDNFEKMADTIAAALASARRHVRILTPYFLPNASLIQALNITAMRGVDVEIYLPSPNNIALVQWASMAQLWQLLEKGCRIHYTQPPFDHTKLMIVDGVWSLIGSMNWDPRSLRLNFEFNVECYSEALARSLNDIVDEKVRSARKVTLDEINGRSIPVRLRDGLARLLTPYL